MSAQHWFQKTRRTPASNWGMPRLFSHDTTQKLDHFIAATAKTVMSVNWTCITIISMFLHYCAPLYQLTANSIYLLWHAIFSVLKEMFGRLNIQKKFPCLLEMLWMQHVRMLNILYIHAWLLLSCYHACNMNAYMTSMQHQCWGNMHGTVMLTCMVGLGNICDIP